MANAMLDARQEGDSYRRVEVITGERRRRWTSEEKARIVAESFEEGANISEVARRNGVSRGLLTVWRRQVAARSAGKAQNFVPSKLAPRAMEGGGKSECISPVQTKPVEIATPPAKVCGVVEIEVNGRASGSSRGWNWRRFRWCYRRFEASGDCSTVRPQGGAGGPAGRLS
ncbi:transposase [Bradyrhizobium sp. USDA 336]|uniref:transposase n=1 Tax=Bradyrhizobium sp. USDA 336 TaxID=3156311 RepID=UPI00384B89EF